MLSKNLYILLPYSRILKIYYSGTQRLTLTECHGSLVTKITGNIMDVVIAVLLAEDNWSSDWDHDDLDPERVNIEDEEE